MRQGRLEARTLEPEGLTVGEEPLPVGQLVMLPVVVVAGVDHPVVVVLPLTDPHELKLADD